MNEPIDGNPFQNLLTPLQCGEIFSKLHLELTSLAVLQVERRDIAEDIASCCLVDLWKASFSEDYSFPVRSFLRNRLAQRIASHKRKRGQQLAAHQLYFTIVQANCRHESAVLHLLARVTPLLLLLEPPEQCLLKLLIEEGLSLEQAACRLAFPITRVKRNYKHAVFKLRKQLGLLKRYW